MAEKVPVVVMVDPNEETTIKPFASKIAKSPQFQAESSAEPQGITGSGTVTYSGGKWDADGTVDQ